MTNNPALKTSFKIPSRAGIEAIAFAVPRFYLDNAELAQARGVDPLKFTVGLGQKQMAVATPCEDSVALAANAAIDLFKNFDVDPSSIGLVVVGTETSVDQSKPIAVYLHEMLGLSSRCRVFETKHACYGAMAGLDIAMHWILSGQARGQKALIVATDIARYGANTPGEPTQGAGAVALLVSDQPRLLEIEAGASGCFSKQVMDFWRPNYSKEAFADGHYSMECYLEALAGAYGMFVENSTVGVEDFAACLYHAPFVKMAQKAHVKLLECARAGGATFAKDSPELAAAVADYKRRTASYLEISARVGNIYTGALFLSLVNLLRDALPELTGRPISLFSYGSGCVSEFLLGRLVDDASARRRLPDFRAALDAREKISVEGYEQILEAAQGMDLNGAEFDPARWGLSRGIVYLGNREHRRCYAKLG